MNRRVNTSITDAVRYHSCHASDLREQQLEHFADNLFTVYYHGDRSNEFSSRAGHALTGPFRRFPFHYVEKKRAYV